MVLGEFGQIGADARVWRPQCGVPASVLVWDCTYGQSPNRPRVAARPVWNSINVEHRAGHDGFDEFFGPTALLEGHQGDVAPLAEIRYRKNQKCPIG